jgi:hypothetical protein
LHYLTASGNLEIRGKAFGGKDLSIKNLLNTEKEKKK